MAKGKALTRTTKDFAGLLNKMEDQLNAVATKHLTAERIVKVALRAASREPKLRECTAESLLQALMDASQVGLEPGPAQHAALIPRKNTKTEKMECHFEVMYQGYRELVFRSGNYREFEAIPVFERDTFRVTRGAAPTIEHAPYMGDEDPGELTYVYSIAWPTDLDAPPSFDYMRRAEVEAIRMRSQAGKKGQGPWATDYIEMAKKTVIKRHRKNLRLSPAAAEQMAFAIEAEGDDVSVGRIIDPEAFRNIEEVEGVPVEGGDEKTGEAERLAKQAREKKGPGGPDDEESAGGQDAPAPDGGPTGGDPPTPPAPPAGRKKPPKESKADTRAKKIESLENLREKARELDLLDADMEQDLEDVIEGGDEQGMKMWSHHLSTITAKALAAQADAAEDADGEEEPDDDQGQEDSDDEDDDDLDF